MNVMTDYNYIHVDTSMSYEETISKVLELISKGYNASFCRVHDLDIYEIHVLKPTNNDISLTDVLDKLKSEGCIKAQLA